MTLGTSGAVTGLTLAQMPPTSPSALPANLAAYALDRAVNTPSQAQDDDSALRAAIVNYAKYWLRLAQRETPSQIEAGTWNNVSIDGVDHGEDCAAFASMTLEMGAQAVGQQSWITGGSTYPWALHSWADVRVDTNPASPNIESLQADAAQNNRWHPLGDGYYPQPGDFVLFDEHVEVVVSYEDDVLTSIGNDSLPNFTVNEHTMSGSLAEAGVVGFIDNGHLGTANDGGGNAPVAGQGNASANRPNHLAATSATPGEADVPGADEASVTVQAAPLSSGPAGGMSVPGATPSAPVPSDHMPAAYRRHTPAPIHAVIDSAAQRAFIAQVSVGAVAGQEKTGIPAAVTIAQAIDESGWGQSGLAQYPNNNLYGIKPLTGYAETQPMPTQEFENGQWVTATVPFAKFSSWAESTYAHNQMIAYGGNYAAAMAILQHSDHLTRSIIKAYVYAMGPVYATDPHYADHLIAVMDMYDLWPYSGVSTPPVVVPAANQPAPSQQAQPVGPNEAEVPGASTPAAAASAPPSSWDYGAGETEIPGNVASANTTTAYMPGMARAQTASASSVRVRATLAVDDERLHLPLQVGQAIVSRAQTPLRQNRNLYRAVGAAAGISHWQIVAALDWMQYHSRSFGRDKLGTTNQDGMSYGTREEAVLTAATHLVTATNRFYQVNLADPHLTIEQLAQAFAAYRWGGRLVAHDISVWDFPYSVAGLSNSMTRMSWPKIPGAPEGGRYDSPYGAVAIAMHMGHPAYV